MGFINYSKFYLIFKISSFLPQFFHFQPLSRMLIYYLSVFQALEQFIKVSLRYNNRMNQGKAQSSTRINNRVALDSSPPSIIHIFVSPNPLFQRNLLIDALSVNHIDYNLHINYKQLVETCVKSQPNFRIVIIESAEIEKKALEEELRRGGLQERAEKGSLKLFTYPSKIPGLKIRNLANPEDVIQQYKKLTGQKRKPKIELKGLSSRSKQQSFSKEKTRQNISSPYQRVYYYNNAQNDYHNELSDIYQRVIQIFQKEYTYQPFTSISALTESKDKAKGKKSLLVIPANGSELLLKEIGKRWKEKEVEVIVVGKAKANEFYLNKNIVLVTNSPVKLYEYLQNCQLISPHLIKTLFQRLIESTSELASEPYQSPRQPQSSKAIPPKSPSKQPQPFLTREADNEYQIPGNNKDGTGNHEGKHKIKRLKSPTKTKLNTEPGEQLNSPNISVHPPSPGPIVQTSEFRTNKQGQIIPKHTSQSEQVIAYSSPNISTVQNQFKSHVANSSHEIGSFQTDNNSVKHSLPPNHLNYKYKSSYVIPETSDEYRGSNKDSLVNFDENKPKIDPSQRHNLDSDLHARHYIHMETVAPLEQVGEKKIVYSMVNSPDRQLISSNENLKEASRSGLAKGTTTFDSQGQARNFNKPKIIRKDDNPGPLQIKIESTNKIEEQNYGNQPQKAAYGQQRYYGTTSPIKYPQSQTSTYQQPTANFQQPTVNFQQPAASPTNYQNFHPATNYNSSQRPLNNLNYQSSAGSNTPAKTNQFNFNYYQSNGLQGNSGTAVSNLRTQTIKAGEVRVLDSNSPPAVVKTQKTSYLSTALNLDGYERVQVNGITMYRKKAQTKPTEAHQLDGSPKVVRYEVSPRRNIQLQEEQKPAQGQPKPASRYYNTYNTYNSYTPDLPQDNYNRGSTYYPTQNNYETYKPTENRGNTYYPQNFTQREGVVQREVDNKEPLRSVGSTENVSIKLIGNDDEFITKISNIKGELKEKAEVQRREYKQSKVEAPNLKPLKPEQEKRESKDLKAENTLRVLNDSNWVSKPSDLLSDGSILRRNNIRFGIKLKQKQQKFNESVMNETKMFNGTYNINDLNRKMALYRKITGEEELSAQQQKYIHIDTHLSATHYLFQEELRYYEKKVNALFGPLDKVDFFACLEELSQKAFSLMDCGFVVMVQEEALKVNPSMLPENYYVILIEKGQDPLLQINQDAKRIHMDSLERLTLAAKIILDSKLNKRVVYKDGDALVEGLADKFAGTEFLTQKLQIQLTNDVLDCYYQDEPRLTRLYIFCLEEELASTLRVINSYEKTNDLFARASCKVICPLKNANNLSKLKKDFPSVVFLSSLSLSYREILEQAHRHDRQISLQIKPDRLYLHEKQAAIAADLEKYFPGRFEIIPFDSLQAVSKKTSKFQLQKFNSYLVLSDSLAGEKIAVENFTKVFMMGRTKALPNNVVRVMKKEELIQLLKK